MIDVTMPELNGLEACRQILKAAPRTEVLILTMHESEEVVVVRYAIRNRMVEA